MRLHKLTQASLALGLLAVVGLPAHAVTEEKFVVKNTADLVDICTTPKTDPYYTAAINFCHGYLVGAFHYQDALYSSPKAKPIVCLPDPTPSRNEGVAQFLKWTETHKQYSKDLAVDAFGKFLAETWPCK